MTTVVSSKGHIVLPAEVRREDDIRPGQQFEIHRIERGEDRLRRGPQSRNVGLAKLLLACPVKGWFTPLDRSVTTDAVATSKLR